MAIVRETKYDSGDPGTVTGITINNIDASNADTVIVCVGTCDSSQSDANITGVTFDSVAGTLAFNNDMQNSEGAYAGSRVYYWQGGGWGSAETLSITFGGKCTDSFAAVWCFSGVGDFRGYDITESSGWYEIPSQLAGDLLVGWGWILDGASFPTWYPAMTEKVGLDVGTMESVTDWVAAEYDHLDETITGGMSLEATGIAAWAPASGNVTVQAGTQNIAFAVPAPTIKYDMKISPALQNLVLGLESPVYKLGIKVYANLQNMTLGLQSPTIKYDMKVSPGVQNVILGLLTPTIKHDMRIFPSAQDMVLALQSSTVKHDMKVSPAVQDMVLALQSSTVKYDMKVSPAVQNLILGLESVILKYDMKVSPAVQNLVLSVLTPTYDTGEETIIPVIWYHRQTQGF